MSDDEVMDEGELEGEILADPDLDAEGLGHPPGRTRVGVDVPFERGDYVSLFSHTFSYEMRGKRPIIRRCEKMRNPMG